jgi:hypothetical protein
MGCHPGHLCSRKGKRGRPRALRCHGVASKHGAKYGVCQIYRNEPWHYERRPDAVDHGCPAPYADPTQDPRTHR